MNGNLAWIYWAPKLARTITLCGIIPMRMAWIAAHEFPIPTAIPTIIKFWNYWKLNLKVLGNYFLTWIKAWGIKAAVSFSTLANDFFRISSTVSILTSDIIISVIKSVKIGLIWVWTFFNKKSNSYFIDRIPHFRFRFQTRCECRAAWEIEKTSVDWLKYLTQIQMFH